MISRKMLLKAFTYFEDPPAVPPTVPPPPPPPAKTTFTQDDVNRMLAENKRQLQQQNTELVQQLESLKNNVNLTAQEKQALEDRITALSQQHMSESERLKQQLESTNKKYKDDTTALTEDSRKWKGSYEKLLVENAITRGAATHKAASAKQMVALLLPQAKVVEDLDDAGKPTGNFVPKVPVTYIDAKTKKPVTLELPIEEAVGKMREDPEFANLFLVDGKPGFGGNNNGSAGSGSGTPDFSKMTAAEHAEWRKKNNISSRR